MSEITLNIKDAIEVLQKLEAEGVKEVHLPQWLSITSRSGIKMHVQDHHLKGIKK